MPLHRVPIHRPMLARSPDESHRASTPLELFFDLVFVVALSRAAATLHHEVVGGHVAQGALAFGMAFFAIWLAWVNFTWFASAYDPGDVVYRLLVFLQIVGALVLAAGTGEAFVRLEPTLGVTGYVIMRLALVAQWWRVSRQDPAHRSTARRYATGIALVQCLWVGFLWLPPSLKLPAFFAFATLDLLVPVWAERARPTTWHTGHIAERHGLFAIIVLGESILSASIAIGAMAEGGTLGQAVLPVVLGGLLIVFGMWWLYFDAQPVALLRSQKGAFLFGLGHYPLLAAMAAVGAGIAVAADVVLHPGELASTVAAAAVTIPVALFLVMLWLLAVLGGERGPTLWWAPATAVLVLGASVAPQAPLVAGVLVAGLIAAKLAHQARHPAVGADPPG